MTNEPRIAAMMDEYIMTRDEAIAAIEADERAYAASLIPTPRDMPKRAPKRIWTPPKGNVPSPTIGSNARITTMKGNS